MMYFARAQISFRKTIAWTNDGRGSATSENRATLIAMCLICIDFERGAMKVKEARRALAEIRTALDPEHVKEVEHKLAEKDSEPDDP